MAWNKIEVGMIEVAHLKTQLVDKQVASQKYDELEGPPFALQVESLGPGTDGVHFTVTWEDEASKLCEFYIPDGSWKTFVAAVKCVDAMWDQHDKE